MSSETFVLVPSYNHAPFMKECLRSIISQTSPPKKLLVIDDGSKDGSPEIIGKVLADCPFDSELIVSENRGLCRTLNEGLALSNGEYFAYIGSDDVWYPEFLAAREKLFASRDKSVLAYGNAVFINELGEPFESTADHRDTWANYSDGDAHRMLLCGLSPISSTVVYRRASLESVSWNPDSRLEDYEMYLNLAELGEFAFDPTVLSAWRHHGYNTSGDIRMMLDEVIETQSKHFTRLGVPRSELDGIQSRTRFRYARMMLQMGHKSDSLGLILNNAVRGGSLVEIGKALVLLLLPTSVNEAYQNNKRARKVRRFREREI